MQALPIHHLIQSSQQFQEEETHSIPILQMRVRRHRAAKHFVHVHTAGKWKGQDLAWTCRFYPSLMLGGCSPPSGAMRQTKEKAMKQQIKCRGPGVIPTQGTLALAFCLTLVPTGERGDCPGPGHCHTAIASVQTSWSCTAGHLPQPNPASSPASRGSCMAGGLPSQDTHTASWSSYFGLLP